MTSTCPECGTESNRVLTEYDRVFPLPRIHLVRFQCIKSGCGAVSTNKRKKTFWDVPGDELEQ